MKVYRSSINRNILECKFRSPRITSIELMVLIETYWNVNVNVQYSGRGFRGVLIETYWNVNLFFMLLLIHPSEY